MSLKDTCESAWDICPATIAGGTNLTGTINLGGLRLFGIAVPATWTAASLTFQMSPDGGTSWYNLQDQTGTEISAAANPSCCLTFDPKIFAPLQYIKLRSGPSSSPVNQTAASTLQLVLRSV
ncbi:MAG: hypothetical protein KGI37_11160 [Alphaproteobacteria bacterium]|nr:hypothetical protein [Alphaproteobacteria bacterium]